MAGERLAAAGRRREALMMRALLKLLGLSRTPKELTERQFNQLVARSRQRCPRTGRFVCGGAA